jgi:hypothetical protein
MRSMLTFARCVLVLLVGPVSAQWLIGHRVASAAQSELRAVFIPSLPVVELRQYTTLPGKRDVLIDLFEREFIEGQEATGMVILAQFRDLDRPNRFVWIRGFADMPSRARSLRAFYDGPVWQKHRAVANGTLVDSNNVLMLKPAGEVSGFRVDSRVRAPRGTTAAPTTLVTAAIYPFDKPVDATFVEFFERFVQPAFERAGGRVLGHFVTESSPNSFPRLPVREGEHVFVWFGSFASEAAYNAHLASGDWRQLTGMLTRRLSGKPELLRLSPTPRSLVGK